MNVGVMQPEATSIRRYPRPGADRIDLWMVFHDARIEESLLQSYRTMLSREERLKASRFYFEIHQFQYIVTRALIRTVLSGYSGVDPRAWRFSANAHGRPVLSFPRELQTLSFNITHTNGLIVCACTDGTSVGVDAEYLTRNDVPVDVAECFFSQPELIELRGVAQDVRAERFFQFWTLKEAYVKAVGNGLGMSLDGFSFSLRRPGHIDLSFGEKLQGDPSRWRFWLIEPDGGHMVAICAGRQQTAQHIVARAVLPLRQEVSLQYHLTAQSS